MTDALEKLLAANLAITTAVRFIQTEMPTIQAFLKEASDMEHFGHVINPTLYRSSERRAVNAMIEPIFKAAVRFVEEHDRHVTRAKAALDQVDPGISGEAT